MKKRVLTTLLALSVMFTSIPVDGLVYAKEATSISAQATEEVQAENMESAGVPENGGDDVAAETMESTEGTAATETPGTESAESTGAAGTGSEGTVPQSTEAADGAAGADSEGTVPQSAEIPGSTEGTESTETSGSTEGTEGTETPGSTEGTEGTETPGSVPGTESTESTGAADGTAGTGSDGTVNMPESTEAAESTEISESTEAAEDDTESDESEEEAPAKLNYVMVESDYLATPATQNIVASIGTTEMKLKDIQLVYQNLSTGEIFKTGTTAEIDDMVLFSLQYANESQSGIYQVVGFQYTYQDKEYELTLKELEMDVRYGVNKDANAAPDQLLQDADTLEQEQAQVDASVVTMDEEGEITSETTVEDVLASGTSGLSLEEHIKGANGNLVVVLDPGHDATHAGAHQNGAAEEELVFKIASYCKAELDTYKGVTVYMTRTSYACPNGGSSVTAGTCNERRVAYAAAVGAHVYVSFHLNSNTNASAHGVGVYYPNSNYNAQIGAVGQGVAAQILAKLTALGLSQWAGGIIIWNAQTDKYPDGSVADYLGVIRNCKKVGIPAVLIEHAFVSNYSDYVNYLSSDEKLKQLGVADAQAIADAYGLSKTAQKLAIEHVLSKEEGALEVQWQALADVKHYEVYRSTKKDSDYQLLETVAGANTYVDSNVELGTKYYYKVRAVYNNGAVSEVSDAVAGRALQQVVTSYIKSKSTKKLAISWEKVTGAKGYYIYRKNADTDAFELVNKVTSGSTLSYVDSVPANNKLYTYKIQAYSTNNGKEGVGPKSETIAGKSVGKTKILSVKPLDHKTLELSWKKVAGASGYEITRSAQIDGKYEKIATISSGETLTYKDDTVKSGKTYYYKIQTVNKNNGKKGVSGYSAVVSAKTVKRMEIVSVISKSENTLEIKWKESADVFGYRVKRSTDKDGTYKVIKTINSSGTTSYKDKKVEVGKKYYYKVEAILKQNGEKSYIGESKIVSGRTVAKTQINYVVSAGSETLQINWNPVDGAWGYRVKRSISKKGTYETVKTIEGADTTTYKDKKVKTGKTYYYKVETINRVNKKKGYSGNSSAVSGKALGKTAITAVKPENSNTISIEWKKVSGSSGYQIYRSMSKNGNYKKVGQVSGAKTTRYEDTGIKAGKNYYYKVRAYKKNEKKTGVGTFTSVQKAFTLKQVEITKVSGTSGKKVTLNWDKVSKAQGYEIYRSTKENSGFKLLKKIDSADTVKFKDDTVKTGKVYYYQIVATAKIKGDEKGYGTYSSTIKVPILQETQITSAMVQEDNTILIEWQPVKNITGYELQVSDKTDGEYKTLIKTDKTSCLHTNLTSGVKYNYKVRAYAQLSNGSNVYSAWSSVKEQTTEYAIMGESSITVQDMVNYYNLRKYHYPAEIYAGKGAATPTDFFQILKEEAEAEGVKAEVLFAQVMLETGGLAFGGDVSADQCNFGGIGATGNGVAGDTFADVRTGLRAQTQHLKAYASKEPLKQACVDPRFQYVSRGCAPYIEWLAIPANPYGKGWAADAAYGIKLLAIISTMKAI